MNELWTVSYVVLWALVLVLCMVVVALARQIGTLHMRLGPRGALEIDSEGPALGEAPPPIEIESLAGETITIGGPGVARVLMFVSPGCHICEQVLPSLRAIAGDGAYAPIVVSDGDAYETSSGLELRDIAVPVIPGPGVAREYTVPGTPYVVVLDHLGVVRAKGTVNNLEQVEGLLDTARDRAHRSMEEHLG